MQQKLADFFGGSTFLASISLSSMEWFDIINVNNLLTTFSLVGGLWWMGYKIKNAMLDTKKR